MNPGKMVWIAGLAVMIGMCGCSDEYEKNSDKLEQSVSRKEVEQMLDGLQEYQRHIIPLQLDGANGFQENLDLLNSSIASAEQAIADKKIRYALKHIKEADKAARWLDKNIPAREEVERLLAVLAESIASADKYEASFYSQELYLRAQTDEREAKTAYEKGEFDTAQEKLKSSIEAFNQAKDEAWKRKVEAKLQIAEKYAGKNWENVRRNAQDVTAIDSNNEKAKQLIRMADNAQLEISKHWENIGNAVSIREKLLCAEKILKLESENEVAKKFIADAQQKLAELSRCLDNAKSHINVDWEKVRYFAQSALEIESSNAEAAKMLKQAEEEIRIAAIKAVLDKARVALDEKKWDQAREFARKVLASEDNADARNIIAKANEGELKQYLEEASVAQNQRDWNRVRQIATDKIALLDSAAAKKMIADAELQIRAEAVAEHLNKAREALSNGEWDDAQDAAKAALDIENDNQEAKKIITDAHNGKINQLVRRAEQARAAEDWKQLIVYAEAILDVAIDHAQAREWLTLAKREVQPTVVIVTLVDGREVNAAFRLNDGTSCRSGERIRDLVYGRQYTADISYKVGKSEYVGECSFTVHEQGMRKKVLSLQKIPFDDAVDCNGVPLEMVKIPGGSFQREENRIITLTREFWLGKYEVTQAQWTAVMKTDVTEQHRLNGNTNSSLNSIGGNYPMYYVSWNEAKAFCDALNRQFRENYPMIKGVRYKFDLPTEAQWEYACRAGTTTTYSYGDNWDESKMVFRSSGARVVGSTGYKNAFGLYDMHGNVWEWCRDPFGKYTSDTVNPKGAVGSNLRVRRGGGWFEDRKRKRSALNCTSSYRIGSTTENFRLGSLGFRLAFVPID